jgi:purine-binding chemotaxis protein CheW
MTFAAPERHAEIAPTRTTRALREGDLVTLSLGTHRCAIDKHLVVELRAYEPPTAVSGMPHFVEGVVSIRGALVPVVDLRLLLACGSTCHDEHTVLAVLALHGRSVGVVADRIDAGLPSVAPAVPHIDIEALLNDAGLGAARVTS